MIESHLTAITAVSHSGYVSKSFAHLDCTKLNKNIKATCYHFNDFTELQFIKGNQLTTANIIHDIEWLIEFHYLGVNGFRL
jgi:hypothetical protein